MESNMYKVPFGAKDSVANEKDLPSCLSSFFRDLDWFLDSELNTMVEKSTPKLMKELATLFREQIVNETKKHIISWRNGDINTLDEVYEKISSTFFDINMTGYLWHQTSCQKVIFQWLKGVVEKDIAREIKQLCDKHAIVDFCGHCILLPILVTNNKTMVNPSAMGETITAIISLVAVMSGVKLYETLSSVILQTLKESIAVALFAALVALGPLGFPVIAGVLGATAIATAMGRLDLLKVRFVEKVSSANLPMFIRAFVTDAKIDKFLPEQGTEQIEEILSDKDLAIALTEEIAEYVRTGIRKKIDVERISLAYL